MKIKLKKGVCLIINSNYILNKNCGNCDLPEGSCDTERCYFSKSYNGCYIGCSCEKCVAKAEEEFLKNVKTLTLIYKQRYPNKSDRWDSLIVMDFLHLIGIGIDEVKTNLSDQNVIKDPLNLARSKI